MKIDLDSIAIKPFVSASIGIGLGSLVNNYISTPFRTIDGEIVGTETLNRIGRNNTYVSPDISVGATVDFENFSIDASYGIAFDIYSNNYDASGFSGSTEGTVSWNGSTQTTKSIATTNTTTNTVLTIDDQSALNHNIHLGFYTDKEVTTGLKLGLYAGAEFGIGTSSSDSYTLTLNNVKTEFNNAAFSYQNTTIETEERTNSTITDTTTFSITPFVNIGAIYEVVPDRFSVNAGISLWPLGNNNGNGYSNTVTRTSSMAGSVQKSKTTDSNGNVTAESVIVNDSDATVDSVNVQSTWNNLRVGFYGGFTFNFNDSASLELAAGGGVESGTFTLNVANLRTLLTFKF